MFFTSWCRLRYRKKTRALLGRYREALEAARESMVSLRNAESYHPICVGGHEDRLAGIDQAQGRLRHWSWECFGLECRLKLSEARADRIKRWLLKPEQELTHA